MRCILLLLTCVAALWTSRPVFALDRIADGLSSPVGMVFDKDGGLLVAEWGANRVTRIAKDGARVVALKDIEAPSGLALDAQGAILVASYSRGLVLRAQGATTTTLASGLNVPAGLHLLPDGALLVADRGAGQLLRLVAGRKEPVAVNLKTPVGVASFADGRLVVSEFQGQVVCIHPDGRKEILSQKLRNPAVGILVLDERSVAVADYGGTAVHRVTTDGQTSVLVDGLSSPVGLALGPDGRLYVATWGDGALYAVALDRSSW